ncbi:hypothetical protein V5O48_010156, partial [Marasmius crinis-equi]
MPFHELSEGAVIVAVLLDKKQPSRPHIPNLTDAIWEIMGLCWAHDHTSRPTAAEVLARIGCITSMKTGTRVESYPAPDWDALQLVKVQKNVKYPAVDTKEFLHVLGKNQLPVHVAVSLFPDHIVHLPSFQPTRGSGEGGGEGLIRKALGQQKRFLHALSTPVNPNNQDRLRETEVSFSEAPQLYRQAQDVIGEARDLQKIGGLQMQQNKLTEAEASFAEALQLHRQAHN